MGYGDGAVRVITGRAKGRKLMSVPGDSTRPITDRVKEALFSILGDWIVDTRVLDLFGGSGGVGIECLSRGAAHVVFIDQNRNAVETIKANLAHTRLEQDATVVRGDSFVYLKQYDGEPFDLIYVAPPQYQGMWLSALKQIDARPELCTEYGSVIVQIHPREDTPVELVNLEEYDRRKYGSTLLIFYASPDALADDEDEENESEDYNEDNFEEEESQEEESQEEESEDNKSSSDQ